MKMIAYTAIFKSGKEIVSTSERFATRLDFYNWICRKRLGKKYGQLIEITCRVL